MTEENKEVVEETTEENVEQTTNEIDESKFESAGDDSVYKVDLSQPPTQESEEVEKQPAEEEKVDVVEEPEVKEEIVEEQVEEQPVLQEITDEENENETKEIKEEEKEVKEDIKEEVKETVVEVEETGKPLPENIQKLIDFMEDTGGDLQDYVQLNRDVSKLDDSEVLDEYYRLTKSHLSPAERSFLLEDTFGVDEEIDDEKTIRKKKIALKEQVAEARAHLDGQKSKYYEEIKAGSKLTKEQQKAIDFFDRHNKESENQRKLSEASINRFRQKTDGVFNDKFKGFDFKVGDKKYRFNVKDVETVKQSQSDITNFIKKFANKDGSEIEDAAGYHKSMFAAMNADAIANHFYQQGKADAIKGQIAKDKNINTEPRQTHKEVNVGGVKYKVMGESSSDIKNRSFKIKSNKSKN